MPDANRLEHLREALAVLAIDLACVHAPAWFLGAGATALTPVLPWRALPAGDGPTFGAVQPSLQEYTETEDAIRRPQRTLAGIDTA